MHCTACGILVALPRIEPMLPALEVWSLNHWEPREVLDSSLAKKSVKKFYITNYHVTHVTHLKNIRLLYI